MPLLDHFHPPLNLTRSWEGFHSAWAAMVGSHLNDSVLPASYFAEPRIHWGTTVEVDVATIQYPHPLHADDGGGTATAVWSPPQAALSIEVPGLDPDVVEVRIMSREGGLRLAAAIELISPANKDRDESRNAFVSKCISYLQSGVGLVIVDVVTSRLANLHEMLLDALDGHAVSTNGDTDSVESSHDLSLYAAGYHVTRLGASAARLDVWPAGLAIGEPLPTLPLWLDRDLCVPLDLETTYQTTCRALRIDLE